FGEKFFLAELQTVIASIFRFAHILHPMRRAAKHELAMRGRNEDVLSEQAAGYRLGRKKAAEVHSFRDRFELRVPDRSKTFRIDPRLAHGRRLRSWRLEGYRRNHVPPLRITCKPMRPLDGRNVQDAIK